MLAVLVRFSRTILVALVVLASAPRISMLVDTRDEGTLQVGDTFRVPISEQAMRDNVQQAPNLVDTFRDPNFIPFGKI